MQDERTVGRPMRDDILQTPRDAFPEQQGIADNDPESRESAGAEMPRVCRPPASEASGLPDCLMDVPQVARFLSLRRR